jgi:hypothetical protein
MRTGAPRRGSVPTEMTEACASLIRDPLLRLKFLRRARIVPPEPGRRTGWPGTALAGLAFLIAAGISAPILIPRAARESRPAPAPAARPPSPTGPSATVAKVWLVEQTPDSETYSNGLRIERQFEVAGQPRRYRAFARAVADGSRWFWRSEPAGIVFHSSESDILPFEPGQNRKLVEHGRGLLAYARERAAYHFIIDRFGRVHSVVQETAKADHAGHSIWADAEWIYVNLNASFLAICFEAQTRPGGGFSPAQIHAGKVLVEMLRSRYGIAEGNCVTHAQVSVNPRNFYVGYHTDWATGFPFAEVGLPDNYELLPPSLLLFGFEADSTYVNLSGAGLRKAVSLAEQQVQQAAEARHLPVSRYQEGLRKRYAAMVAAVGGAAAM